MTVNFLGQFLLQKGDVTAEQLERAMEYQREQSRRIGELAVEQGLLTRAQAERVFREQKKVDLPFGELAVRGGYLEQGQLDDLLFSQTVGSVYLGEALLHLGFLTQERYSRLMREYDRLESSRRLDMRCLLEETGESGVSASLVEALGKAFTRFGHEGIKVDSVGRDPDLSAHALSFLLDARVKGMGRVRCCVYLDLDVACRLVENLAGTEVDGAEECVALGREFFAIVDRYFRAALERRGFEVSKRRKAIQAGPAAEAEEACEAGMAMGLATPSGPVALRVHVQARG